jgi:hypothetical protein
MRAVEAAINVTKQRTSEWIRNTSNSAISMLENQNLSQGSDLSEL